MARVLFVTGSYPPEVCGVGDYTKRLLTELSLNKVDYVLFAKTNWDMVNFFVYYKEIRKISPDIFHIQYPTEGYGFSLLPLFLLMSLRGVPKVLTLHEFSNRTWKAKLFTLVLTIFVQKVIVTNDRERTALFSFLGFMNRDFNVIGIGSNIPTSINCFRNIEFRELDLVYFGHIRPEKGLETFLKVAARFNCRKVVIGQTLEKYFDYFLTIRDSNPDISFILNGSLDEVSSNLANSKIVYLPFPDGVSTRRGSLIAAIDNGAVVVSRPSSNVEINSFFLQCIFLVENENLAIDLVERILMSPASFNPNYDRDMIFMNNNWSYVARQHLNLYSQLCAQI
jgi:glycosyltransferase involved in cell wall biosynthesis